MTCESGYVIEKSATDYFSKNVSRGKELAEIRVCKRMHQGAVVGDESLRLQFVQHLNVPGHLMQMSSRLPVPTSHEDTI